MSLLVRASSAQPIGDVRGRVREAFAKPRYMRAVQVRIWNMESRWLSWALDFVQYAASHLGASCSTPRSTHRVVVSSTSGQQLHFSFSVDIRRTVFSRHPFPNPGLGHNCRPLTRAATSHRSTELVPSESIMSHLIDSRYPC